MKYTDEHIEQYILGLLDEPLRAELIRAAQSDQVLQDRISMQRDVIGAIQNLKSDEKTEKAIAAASSKFFSNQTGQELLPNEEVKIENHPKKAKKIPLRKWVMAIAALFLMGVLIGKFLVRDKASNGKELYASNFAPAAMLEIDRSSVSNVVDSLYMSIYQFYNDGDFQLAIEGWEENNLLDRATPKVLHYAGNAYMMEEDFTKAKSIFARILAAPDNIYQNGARWNLALMDIRTDNTDQARDHLNEIIAQESGKYFLKAQELLKKL